jgi:acetyltransferase-like isoleucine patch superfamily enzyme
MRRIAGLSFFLEQASNGAAMSFLLSSLRRACLLPRSICQEGIDRYYAPLLLRMRKVVCGKNPHFHGAPVIRRNRDASIVIGNNVTLNSRMSANVLYLAHPCTIAAIRPGASIQIGNGVGMSGATLVAAAGIEIGDRTLIGAEAVIVDTDFHPLDPNMRDVDQSAGAISRPVRIGKRVFIGTRVIILKGVSIGDDAVVGAGAVVTKDVAAGDIVAGNPARVVGSVANLRQTNVI